jgi:hypothetical protein
VARRYREDDEPAVRREHEARAAGQPSLLMHSKDALDAQALTYIGVNRKAMLLLSPHTPGNDTGPCESEGQVALSSTAFGPKSRCQKSETFAGAHGIVCSAGHGTHCRVRPVDAAAASRICPAARHRAGGS